MPTVAEQLRAAREARKLTIEQVADMTKIRTDHLRALEQGNFNTFPAVIYIRGSVKNYAAALKLDVPQILAALDAELKNTEKFAAPPPLVEQHRGPLERIALLAAKISSRMVFTVLAALILTALIALGIWAWVHHAKTKPPPNLPPAVYQPGTAGDTLPLPNN
jgi:cytoskeletal protein RodZ